MSWLLLVQAISPAELFSSIEFQVIFLLLLLFLVLIGVLFGLAFLIRWSKGNSARRNSIKPPPPTAAPAQNRAGSVENKVSKQIPEKRIKCSRCDGHYVLRSGPYGIFAGCSNYPRCTSTLKLRDFVKQVIRKYGINIYGWYKECYQCKKETMVLSYYLAYDLAQIDPAFDQCCEIGLGDIPELDAIVSERFPTIRLWSGKRSNRSYYANFCTYCQFPQGHYYVVEDPDEIFNDRLSGDMEQYYIDTLLPSDETLIESIANRVISEYSQS